MNEAPPPPRPSRHLHLHPEAAAARRVPFRAVFGVVPAAAGRCHALRRFSHCFSQEGASCAAAAAFRGVATGFPSSSNRTCHTAPGRPLSRIRSCGGVPKYLEEVRPSLPADENVRRMCFLPDGILFRAARRSNAGSSRFPPSSSSRGCRPSSASSSRIWSSTTRATSFPFSASTGSWLNRRSPTSSRRPSGCAVAKSTCSSRRSGR